MPWQRMVADVGGELDSDTGLPAYREVIFTVPRQSGKTTVILGFELQRALGWGSPQRIIYSAQSGNDARKKLVEDQFPLLEPRKKRFMIRQLLRGMGAEGIVFTNGSRLGLLASTADSGHGKTVDLAVKDELFADYDDRRDQALVPAMLTKPAAQVITASTMGTDDSIPLNRAVDRGRLAVETGTRSGIAYFEWSSADGEDPDDPATWWGCMPALGYTVTEAVVAHSRSNMTDGEFCRAMLNRRTKADDRVIPAAAWEAICSDTARPADPLVFALDVNPDRSAGAIVAASGGDLPVAELLRYDTGTSWMVDAAVQLDRLWHSPVWAIDATGPAGALVGDLERAGIKVHPVTAREMIDACGQFYDAVMNHRLRIRRHARLDEAAAGAAKRSVGDAWAWTRKNAAADVCPLMAATLALWAAANHGARESDFVLI